MSGAVQTAIASEVSGMNSGGCGLGRLADGRLRPFSYLLPQEDPGRKIPSLGHLHQRGRRVTGTMRGVSKFHVV
jgi:hypothetical protein